jgi:hypothetical protein
MPPDPIFTLKLDTARHVEMVFSMTSFIEFEVEGSSCLWVFIYRQGLEKQVTRECLLGTICMMSWRGKMVLLLF